MGQWGSVYRLIARRTAQPNVAVSATVPAAPFYWLMTEVPLSSGLWIVTGSGFKFPFVQHFPYGEDVEPD